MSLTMSMTRQGMMPSHLKQGSTHSSQDGWGSRSMALPRSIACDAPQEHGSKNDSNDPSEKALYVTNSLEGWLNNENLDYQGMLLKRSPSWGDNQEWIDRVSAGGVVFGKDGHGAIQTRDDVLNGGRHDLIPRLQEAGKELLEIAQERGGAVPEALGAQIKQDIVDIGTVVGALTSECPSIQVKLEVQGHNICQRWHQDHYVCRAIVTYTGMGGTMYTDASNVDMWELENCGINECIIRDKSKICSAGVGDILFMKGKLFPRGKQGLVHKSAEKMYHGDGSIVNRLTLKIDVMDAEP